MLDLLWTNRGVQIAMGAALLLLTLVGAAAWQLGASRAGVRPRPLACRARRALSHDC